MKIRTKVASIALTSAMILGGTGTAFAAEAYGEGNSDTIVNLNEGTETSRSWQGGGGWQGDRPERWTPPAFTGSIDWNVVDAKVGTERVVTVSGLDAGETVTMTLTRPDGTTVTLTATANRRGVATFTFTPDQAGKYSWAITRTFEIPEGFKGAGETVTVTIGEGTFRSRDKGHGGGNKVDRDKCDRDDHKDCDHDGRNKGDADKTRKPATPAPGTKHPVTGAPAALIAVGGGLLATAGGSLLVAQKRRNG